MDRSLSDLISAISAATVESALEVMLWERRNGVDSSEFTAVPDISDLMVSIERLQQTAMRIKKERDTLLDLVSILVGNASLIENPSMEGLTDCYAIPCEDYEMAAKLLEALKS